MQVVGGIVCVFVMVFGGYTAAGGKYKVIIASLPFEFVMIVGAAVGAFIIGNTATNAKKALNDVKLAFKGPKWVRQDYIDLLCLMFNLTKLIKTKGLLALEAHIETPEESDIFSQYPRIVAEHHVTHFICDILRLMTMSFENPYQVGDVMQAQIDKHHHEETAPARSIQGMADALPAIGIVAAVLGIIKTMSSIDQPAEYLGKLIGGALVGTFLGVFLAYCFVGPFAAILGEIYEEEGQFFNIIRDIIISHLHGNAPQISVEIGRGLVPGHFHLSFAELEDAMNGGGGEG